MASTSVPPGGTAASASLPGNAVSFVDPTGDVTPGPGPDVTAVTVYRQGGHFTLQVEFASSPALKTDTQAGTTDFLMIPIQTTAKSTGKRSAFAIDVTPDRMRFRHCAVLGCNEPFDSKEFVVTTPTISGNMLTLSIDEKLLLNPKTISFFIAAAQMTATSSTDSDRAPNANSWTYTVT
jgi:hypothetical protein